VGGIRPIVVPIIGQDKASNVLGRVGRRIDSIGRKMTNTGRWMATRVTAPLALGLGLMVHTAAGYEASMNRVQVLTQANAVQFAQLSSQARDLGATTQFSASQAADAMGFLSMAGFQANQILAATPGVLDLASAAQIDLARSADIASNILTGYGLSADRINRVNDVMVGTFIRSNTNLEQLGEAMKMVAPIAAAMKVPFEQTAAAIGLLGNAGIQATMAGTGLRGILSKITDPSAEAKKRLTALGIGRKDILDSQGNLSDLVGLVRQLQTAGATAADMLVIFGERAGPSMAALVGQGADELLRLSKILQTNYGEANRVAQVQMRGFAGAVKELRSASEELGLAIMRPGEAGGPLDILTAKVKGLAAATRELGKTNPVALNWGLGIAGVLGMIGPLLIGGGGVVWGFKMLLPVFVALTSPIALIAGGLASIAIYLTTISNLLPGVRTGMASLQGATSLPGPIGAGMGGFNSLMDWMTGRDAYRNAVIKSGAGPKSDSLATGQGGRPTELLVKFQGMPRGVSVETVPGSQPVTVEETLDLSPDTGRMLWPGMGLE